MNSSELHGTLVLVHPDLKDDPAKKQGQVGILTYMDSGDRAFVSFLDNKEGQYDTANLFQLKEREHLFESIDDPSSLSVRDYKDIYQISLLQDYGGNKGTLRALEIAANNPSIWEKTMVKVEDILGLKMEQSLAGRSAYGR